jgi:hypothetical protein
MVATNRRLTGSTIVGHAAPQNARKTLVKPNTPIDVDLRIGHCCVHLTCMYTTAQ